MNSGHMELVLRRTEYERERALALRRRQQEAEGRFLRAAAQLVQPCVDAENALATSPHPREGVSARAGQRRVRFESVTLRVSPPASSPQLVLRRNSHGGFTVMDPQDMIPRGSPRRVAMTQRSTNVGQGRPRSAVGSTAASCGPIFETASLVSPSARRGPRSEAQVKPPASTCQAPTPAASLHHDDGPSADDTNFHFDSIATGRDRPSSALVVSTPLHRDTSGGGPQQQQQQQQATVASATPLLNEGGSPVLSPIMPRPSDDGGGSDLSAMLRTLRVEVTPTDHRAPPTTMRSPVPSSAPRRPSRNTCPVVPSINEAPPPIPILRRAAPRSAPAEDPALRPSVLLKDYTD